MIKMYTQRNYSTTFALLTGALVTLAGCGGGGGSSGGGTGAVSLSVIDAPIDDALKVCITFDSVEFKGDSDPIDREPRRTGKNQPARFPG